MRELILICALLLSTRWFECQFYHVSVSIFSVNRQYTSCEEINSEFSLVSIFSLNLPLNKEKMLTRENYSLISSQEVNYIYVLDDNEENED